MKCCPGNIKSGVKIFNVTGSLSSGGIITTSSSTSIMDTQEELSYDRSLYSIAIFVYPSTTAPDEAYIYDFITDTGYDTSTKTRTTNICSTYNSSSNKLSISIPGSSSDYLRIYGSSSTIYFYIGYYRCGGILIAK